VQYKIARIKAGLTQIEVAKLIGVTPLTICRWETEKVTPPANRVKDLAKLYNVTADYLLEME